MFVSCAVVAAALTLVSVVATARAQPPPPPDQFRPFDGSWSASGVRQAIPTENGGRAAVAHLSGAVVLSNGTGLTGGFTGEAIGFDDGTNVTTGRAVWTDSAGDRIFSTLRGGPLQTGRRITGTFTGGTGRWTGVVGDYELTWQYVVASDDDAVQGRSVDLHGRLRWQKVP
jgi:hypothetical protein